MPPSPPYFVFLILIILGLFSYIMWSINFLKVRKYKKEIAHYKQLLQQFRCPFKECKYFSDGKCNRNHDG